MIKKILVTGVTGTLGQFLVPLLLDQGWEVHGVIRGNIKTRKKKYAWIVHDNFIPINCDLRQDKDLVLIDRHVSRHNVSAILHLAACTSLSQTLGVIAKDNVKPTVALAQLASKRNVFFFHMSTAYVAGDYSGEFAEADLAKGQGFFNAYEESKYQAEMILHNMFSEDGLKGAVIRTSIITGEADSGAIGEFKNLYAFLRLLSWLKSGFMEPPVYLSIPESGRINCVPLDWVCRIIAILLQYPASEVHGLTFHLTSDRPIMVTNIIEWLFPHLGLDKNMLILDNIDKANALDKKNFYFNEGVKAYIPYTRNDIDFDSRNLSALNGMEKRPLMNKEYVVKIYQYAERFYSARGRSLRATL